MRLDHPYQFDHRNRTATTTELDHVKDLIELVIFSSPGERLNRPDFGSGVMQLIFAPNSPELAATTEFLVKGALQQWLGDLITVLGLVVENDDATLRVTIEFAINATGERDTATFERGGGGL